MTGELLSVETHECCDCHGVVERQDDERVRRPLEERAVAVLRGNRDLAEALVRERDVDDPPDRRARRTHRHSVPAHLGLV